jgi:hypothetical protein
MFGSLVLLKRWHWAMIAIAIGLAAGYAALPTSLDVRAYGEGLNGPKDYERNLIRDTEGRRRFTDLVVHRQSVTTPSGGTREAWIVSGTYCGNAPEPSDRKWHWRPKFFVADEPYNPAVALAELTGGVGAERIARFKQLPNPTVVDFLEILRDMRGVHFTHAWWRTHAMATWFIGSFVLIGLIWPTVIDLVAYGRFIRPREKKEVDRPASTATAPEVRPQVTAEDLEKLNQLDAALEEGLKPTAAPATAAVPVASAPIRKLNGDAQPATAVLDPKDPCTFGAKKDDFYPTARKANDQKH